MTLSLRWRAALLCVTASGYVALLSQPKSLASFDSEVKPLVARMTLDEKIGQMTQPEQSALKDQADIENYFVGSLLSGGDSDPAAGNSLQAWTDLYDQLQSHTQKTRLRIPILYGIDAVHGHNNVLGAVISRTTSGWGVRAMPLSSKKWSESRRTKCARPESSGLSRRASPCRRTSDGAAPMKASAKIRRW